MNILVKNFSFYEFLLLFILIFPGYSIAAEDSYFSKIVNQSNQPKYKLVKTRVWPETGCVLDSGSAVINPGESSNLRVSKNKGCDQAGIGYSLYEFSDKKNQNLIGYVSHRFRDGKFSLQVSIFCVGQECVFKDLNPQQKK